VNNVHKKHKKNCYKFIFYIDAVRQFGELYWFRACSASDEIISAYAQQAMKSFLRLLQQAIKSFPRMLSKR
jgi:hypothetical protein